MTKKLTGEIMFGNHHTVTLPYVQCPVDDCRVCIATCVPCGACKGIKYLVDEEIVEILCSEVKDG